MKYKYRNYWIQAYRNNNNRFDATIWINSHSLNKKTFSFNSFSLSLAQVEAEDYIEKILSVGGILK